MYLIILVSNFIEIISVENHRESLIKELTDVKRQLADASFEREKYSSSNKELREHVKRVEGQKREQARSLEEALQKITGNNSLVILQNYNKLDSFFMNEKH